MARAKSRGAARAEKPAKRSSIAPAKPAKKATRKKTTKAKAKTAKKAASAPARRASSPPAPPKRPSVPPARPRRPSTRPPPAHVSRVESAPWPASEWSPENHDVASAQDVLLMAYWIADQLADPSLAEHRRTALRAAVRSVAPILRGAGEGLTTFIVAATVRRNSAIMLEAQRSERERLPEGNLLNAVLETHEDEAVHATVAQIRLHSPETASWLEELERRGRPELRNALRAGDGDGAPSNPLRRLLAVVLFATGQLSRRSKPAPP